MKVKQIVEKLNLKIVSGPKLDQEISGIYIGDLLSNVMAKAKSNNLWLTVQGHQNVVAVALLVDLAAVILVEDFDFDQDAIEKANAKGINLLKTDLQSYELVSYLKDMGL